MAYEIEDDITPSFLINGFLKAGKTQFLDFTMQQGCFKTEGETLLIVCEEGDTEYDGKRLGKNKTAVVFMDNMRKLTPQYLNEPGVTYQPERVLMEWSGMWNQDGLKLPDGWTIYQRVTITNGSTSEFYVQNMKPFLGVTLRDSELVVVNRCDGIPDDKLTAYRRVTRAMSRENEAALEDKEGEIEQAALEKSLPYDLGADVIEIKPEDCGIRYVDCMDQSERYKDKMVEFTAMVLKSPKFPRGQFVPGRMAITCCEADMTFLGFMCKWPGAEGYETKQWIRVRARIGTEHQEDYRGKGSVPYAEHMERVEETKDVMQFQEQWLTVLMLALGALRNNDGTGNPVWEGCGQLLFFSVTSIPYPILYCIQSRPEPAKTDKKPQDIYLTKPGKVHYDIKKGLSQKLKQNKE